MSYVYIGLCIRIWWCEFFLPKFPCQHPDTHVATKLQCLILIGNNVFEQHGSPRFAARIRHSISDSHAMTLQLAPTNQWLKSISTGEWLAAPWETLGSLTFRGP